MEKISKRLGLKAEDGPGWLQDLQNPGQQIENCEFFFSSKDQSSITFEKMSIMYMYIFKRCICSDRGRPEMSEFKRRINPGSDG